MDFVVEVGYRWVLDNQPYPCSLSDGLISSVCEREIALIIPPCCSQSRLVFHPYNPLLPCMEEKIDLRGDFIFIFYCFIFYLFIFFNLFSFIVCCVCTLFLSVLLFQQCRCPHCGTLKTLSYLIFSYYISKHSFLKLIFRAGLSDP